MRFFSSWLCALLLCLTSCATNCGGNKRRDETTADESKQARTSLGGAAAQQPGKPPRVVVKANIDDVPPKLDISVANHASDEVTLARALRVERRADGRWKTAYELGLRYDCQTEPANCMTLAPGAELLPPAFTQTHCGCEPCKGLASGSYRIAVTSCDGTHTIYSDTFSYPLETRWHTARAPEHGQSAGKSQ